MWAGSLDLQTNGGRSIHAACEAGVSERACVRVPWQCNSIDRPFLSIPVASFASVLTSLVLYCFLLTVMALMAPAHLLVTHQELFLEYAYPTYYIGYATTSEGQTDACSVRF